MILLYSGEDISSVILLWTNTSVEHTDINIEYREYFTHRKIRYVYVCMHKQIRSFFLPAELEGASLQDHVVSTFADSWIYFVVLGIDQPYLSQQFIYTLTTLQHEQFLHSTNT